MAVNIWTERGRVLGSYRKDGVLSIRDLTRADYTAFAMSPDVLLQDPRIVDRHPDFPGWWRFTFLDWESRRVVLEANPTTLFEADVSPARRFFTDHYCVVERPVRAFIDIETDSRVPFSKAILGEARLLSWALVSGSKRWSAVLQDDADQADAELLAELWRVMGEFDQIGCWNGDRFDFAVIEAKSQEYCKRFSRTMEPYWDHKRRLLFVDQMLCYKRHHMSAESGDEKTSLRLDAVCEQILKQGKLDFDSSKTWDAWAAGGARRQELVDYNIQDAALLPKLEEATGYLQLQQTIGEVTLTPVNSHTLKPMPWIDAYLLKLAHKQKTHLPSKKPGGGEADSVEGAIVIPPTELGVHENVHVADFKSLYPTCIRTWNIGHDSKLTTEQPGACRAANGVWFSTASESMLALLCRELMELRSFWKKRKKSLPVGSAEWKEAEQKDKAYKIANNSAYGVTGNPYFRIFDPEITGAVTAGARALLLATVKYAGDVGKRNIYSDTDSCMIKGGTPAEFTEFVRQCNVGVFPKLLDEYGCRPEFRCIELDYEKQFSILVFPLGTKGTPSAKRYFGRYSDAAEDGRPEIRGLEYMRTDTTRATRRMQRTLIDMILRNRVTAQTAEEWVKQQRMMFFDNPVELADIVLSKGISRSLDAYKMLPPHVRIARAMAESGEDVGEGTRISYVVTNDRVSPAEVIPASEFTGNNCDKVFYWRKQIYPATMRVLAGAFPTINWSRWTARYPKPVLAGQLRLDRV